MSRTLILVYGLVGYLTFLATFLYLVGFVMDVAVPLTVDRGGPKTPLPQALLIDLGLVLLFGVQHSVMARPRWKRATKRLLAPAIERTTFLFATCAVLAVLFTQWRPIDAVVWRASGVLADALFAVSCLGIGIVLLSTFLIDHFDLFGLRQSVLAFRGRPYVARTFSERSLYRLVRHPLMLGFLIAFWSAPTLTLGRAVFAAAFTCYILVALWFEERDLVAEHGDAYREYQRRVPKLLPRRRVARAGA
jgi:protein-S-isoprenylcysteine O-methyltransferase Ste14